MFADPSDVDGDRDLDLVIINQNAVAFAAGVPGNIAVILNEPDGLGAPMTHSIGVAPTDLALRELNFEGGPDIAVANGGDGTVTLLVNQGGGIYSTGIVLQVGDNPLSVESADFDGDGDNDLAVVATDPILQTPAVLIFENIGQGPGDLAFAVPIVFTVDFDGTATPNFLAVGDFNGDGEPDLVTVNTEQAAAEDGGPPAGSVSVFLNKRPPCPGDANFDAQVGITDFLVLLANWGLCQVEPCPGDVDGDGTVGIVDFLLVLANWGDCP